MKKMLSDYIKSKDDFDRFCNLFLKKEVSPFIKVYDAPGPDQGIDADYTGVYIDFSESALHVQIDLLNRDTFPLIVFIVLNGFFSNLVSLEDCVAKIINIVYDLLQDDRSDSKIRQELENKAPNCPLIAHLRIFYAIGQNGKSTKTGSPFNIARAIRNQLVHDDIAEVVFFPTLSLLGLPNLDFYFNNLFFPANTPAKHNDTEMIAFCKDVYQRTVDFVDECYSLRDDLQHSGALPV